MLDLFYMAISLSCLALFLILWKRVEVIRPFYILFWAYFLFVVLGGFYDGYSRFYEVSDEAKLVVLVGLLSILSGGVIARIVFPGSELSIKRSYFSSQFNKQHANNIVVRRLALSTFFVGCVGTLIIYARIDVVPILSEDPQYYRTRTLQGIGLYYHTSRYLIYFSLGLLALLSSTGRFSRFGLVILTLLSSILLFGYAIRMNSIMAVGIPFLVYYYRAFYWGRFVMLYCGSFLIFVLFIGGVLQYYRSYEHVKNQGLILFSFDSIMHRPWVQIENVNYLVEGLGSGAAPFVSYYADLTKLLPGASLPNGGVVLHDLLGLNFIGGGITPSIAGEAYVNIGWVGVSLVPFLYAFIVEVIYISMSRNFSLTNNKEIHIVFLLLIAFMSLAIATSTFFSSLIFQALPAIICLFILFFIKPFARWKR